MASTGGEAGESISLNLNPMLDIFSILITFLLMSFSTDPISHDIAAGIELPDSLTSVSLTEIPAIVVTKGEILVNEKKVAAIVDGDVEERARSQGAIYPLFEELEKLHEANKEIKKRLKTDLAAGSVDRITMEMDKGHNFKLMKRVMLSAQQAEFIQFNLMVAKELN